MMSHLDNEEWNNVEFINNATLYMDSFQGEWYPIIEFIEIPQYLIDAFTFKFNDLERKYLFVYILSSKMMFCFSFIFIYLIISKIIK